MEAYWEANGHAPHSLKYESEASVPGYTYCGEPGLNFSANNTTYSEDDADFPPGRRGKTSRQDPLSHRIIEKRRRDRMNSCLADLSRLIPQQYMRKGRGRVEKTEIIEMAIRHLKNLQNQECGRETACAEQYRLGYNECLTEAAKFMMRERGEEMCFRMVAHLKEHCNEIMKGELAKARCGAELANGGSPIYLASGQLGHLREILTCPSDLEHSSNDHHDVKDLSFRSATSTSSSSHSNNPPQAAVITSTAPSIVQHLDTSSNHSTQDYDAPSPPARSLCSNGGVAGLQQDTNNNINQHESVLRTIRMRKFSEHASPEHEHSHNSYKFKNYIQQRFSQDTHENGHGAEYDRSPVSLHEDQHLHQHSSSLRASPLTNGSSGSVSGADSKSSSTSTLTGKSSTVASSSDEPLSLKRKAPSGATSNGAESPAAGGGSMENGTHHHHHHHHHHNQQNGVDCAPMEKKLALSKNGHTMAASSSVTPLPEIKHELLSSIGGAGAVVALGQTATGPGFAHQHHHQQQQQQQHHHSSYHPVPIFACHTQGFYIPLNIDYETLLPYLNGVDLLSKSFLQMPPLHPISISVNYTPSSLTGTGSSLLLKASTVNGLHSQTKAKLVEGIINGC
ncbi:transcription factor cwo [Anopheles stephensi]|uniref:transcription factor cwo n=1 Tax=Anopheles stephensi TaxID=30069 RepID=UPI0016589D77|nr:transcription factor cwo [Anopheles stephensi]